MIENYIEMNLFMIFVKIIVLKKVEMMILKEVKVIIMNIKKDNIIKMK